MFELNGQSVTLEQLQEDAKKYDVTFDVYLEEMKKNGLVEKTQGAAATDVAVAPKTDTELASENISLKT
jgi:hypothetical protein